MPLRYVPFGDSALNSKEIRLKIPRKLKTTRNLTNQMKKLTTEEWIEKAKHTHGNKYDYSKVVYEGANTKVCIICPIHGEFWQTPDKHLNAKRGCSKCGGSYNYTTEEFIEKVKETHGNRYDYNKVEYINAKTKVCIICREHGEFYQTANEHLSGSGCMKCAGIYNYTTEEWIEKAKQVHGNKYDYRKVEYINANTKIWIICPIHGEFLQTAGNHLQGYGCPKCKVDILKSTFTSNRVEFIEKAKQVHGDKYDYHKVEYINANTKVCIICQTHGEFWQTPGSHLSGQGCMKCAGIYNYTTEEWVEKAKQGHGNIYDYSKVEYVNANTKVYIICPIHGDFLQTPTSHLSGAGCPKCNESKLEKETADLLEQYNIKFVGQKKFDWLKHKKPLRIDFYLPEYNIAIECQGMQHFEAVEYWGGKEGLKRNQKIDQIKKELCKENNLPLHYINFDDNVIDKLNEIISKYKTQ